MIDRMSPQPAHKPAVGRKTIFSLENSRYENQLFTQMLLLVAVPLLAMGLIAYSIYVSGERRRSLESLDARCQSISQSYDNIFSQIRDYYLNVTSTKEYQWLRQQQTIPFSQYLELKEAITRLQGNYYLMRYASNYTYLNVANGWALNNYGMFRLGDTRNYEDVQAFLETERQQPVAVRWSNRLDEKSPYNAATTTSRIVDFTGIQLVIKETSLDGGISHLLLIKMNQQELLNLAAGFKTSGYELVIISDGKVALQTNEFFAQAIMGSVETGAPAGSGVYAGVQGERYQVSRQPLLGQNIVCYVGYDSNYSEKNGRVFVVASMLFAATMVLLLIAIRYFALRFSKPVRSLLEQVGLQKDRIREMLISDLMKGGMAEETISESLEKLETKPASCYRLIGMMGKKRNSQDKVELESIGQYLPQMPDTIRLQLFWPAVSYGNVLLALIGAEDEFQLDEKTAVVYKQIKDWAAQCSGHAIASGVSQKFISLKSLGPARQECAEALHNRQNLKDELSSLILYDDYRTRDYMRNAYDMIVENELTNAMANGNEEESKHLLELCVERLEQFNVTGLERNLYVIRLLTAILSVPGSVGIPVGQIFESEQYNIINHASQIYNKKKLTAYVEAEIMAPVIRTVATRIQSEASEIVKQVLLLIKEEKGAISLNDCAKRLNYHPNYIWKFLKTELKMTFTELANEERLELAKYLLLTTDDPVGAIAEKLRYTNVQNFIRFFKAQVGSTPAAFRKAHKHYQGSKGNSE